MPPKVDKKKKKRGLKQKQKQNVKQTVRVQVQSSGGSGAGGTSVPALPIPPSFLDRSGEDVRIRGLVEQAIAKRDVPRVVEQKEAIPADPSNDAETLKALFQAQSDLFKPLAVGQGAISEQLGQLGTQLQFLYEKNQPKQRGGAREGAGRKKSGDREVQFEELPPGYFSQIEAEEGLKKGGGYGSA